MKSKSVKELISRVNRTTAILEMRRSRINASVENLATWHRIDHPTIDGYFVDLYIEKYPATKDKSKKNIEQETMKKTSWTLNPELKFFGDIPQSCVKFKDAGFEGDVLYSTGRGEEVAIGFKSSLGTLLDDYQELPKNWHEYAGLVK